MHKQGHNTDPDSLPAITTVHNDVEPPPTEYDDEPIHSNTHLMDPSVPYRFTITLPSQYPPAYGRIFLSNRQVIWTVDILDTFVPTDIPNPLRDAILSHTPTIPARLAKDDCSIYCLAIQDLTSSHYCRLFRDATITTLHQYLTAHEHRTENSTTTKRKNYPR